MYERKDEIGVSDWLAGRTGQSTSPAWHLTCWRAVATPPLPPLPAALEPFSFHSYRELGHTCDISRRKASSLPKRRLSMLPVQRSPTREAFFTLHVVPRKPASAGLVR